MRTGAGAMERWVMILAARTRPTSTRGFASSGEVTVIITGTSRPIMLRTFPTIRNKANFARDFFRVASSVTVFFFMYHRVSGGITMISVKGIRPQITTSMPRKIKVPAPL